MDAKNLAVLQKLKEQMSPADEIKPGSLDARRLLSLFSDLGYALNARAEQGIKTKKKSKPKKSTVKPTCQPPNSSKSAARTKPKSVWHREDAFKSNIKEHVLTQAVDPSKHVDQPAKVKAECSVCRRISAIDFVSTTSGWICRLCIRAERRERIAAELARAESQYSSGSGVKVTQIQRKIAELNEKIQAGGLDNPRGLLLQIDQLEKRLKLEKVHAISKLGSIRARKLPGSYGSNK